MKKLAVFSVVLAVFLSMAVAPMVQAGEQCLIKGASAKACDAKTKAAGDAGAISDAGASAKACTPEQMAACAKMMGMTVEEHARLCGGSDVCKMAVIDVKGMTCEGCENTITAALTDIPGVLKIVKVSYKDEAAWVCYDPAKCKTDAITTAITGKGYKAQVVPAVAKASDSDAGAAAATAGSKCGATERKTISKDKGEGSY
jgi:copper chaperone CopZ